MSPTQPNLAVAILLQAAPLLTSPNLGKLGDRPTLGGPRNFLWFATQAYHTAPSLEPLEDPVTIDSEHRVFIAAMALGSFSRWDCDVAYNHDRPATQEHNAAIDDGLVEPGHFLRILYL